MPRWLRVRSTFTGGGALAAVLLLFGTASLNAQVTSPLQTGHYVPGVANIRDYVTPAPGFYALWYNVFLSSDTYVDGTGVDVDMDLKSFATVPALFWASTFTLLGGARYQVSVAPSWLVADYTFVTDPGGPGFPPAGNQPIQGSVSGFSDLEVTPVGLSWALGRFKEPAITDAEAVQAGLAPPRRFNLNLMYSFYAPTGRYVTGADDNIGLGFWTHQFQGFGYWYPVADQATAIMAGLTYELNSQIKDVDVTPGNRVSLEYGVSQYFTPWFELGIHGANIWQVTDDSGSDVYWDPSVHDRKGTLLFSAGFWPWSQRLYLNAKYGFDYGALQRLENDYLMLNVVFVTNLLDGR